MFDDANANEDMTCFVCGASLEYADRYAHLHSKAEDASICLCLPHFEVLRKIGVVDYVTITSSVNKVLKTRTMP